MKLSKRKKAIFALILVNIIWGASFPIYKWTLEEIPPFTFVFIRFFIGAIILLPFALDKFKIEKNDILKIFAASFAGITLCISFLFMGLRLAPSINSSIIMSASPIILILAAIFYFHERPKRKVVFGTIVSLTGIMIIILRPLLENGINLAILGNLLFLMAALGGIIHTLILEKIMKLIQLLQLHSGHLSLEVCRLFPWLSLKRFSIISSTH
jgi:drug/metabolite transporter (DMT)-like permease